MRPEADVARVLAGPPVFKDEERWSILLDHVHLPESPPHPDPDAVVLYRVTKRERLMIPQAHFYGTVAYGVIYVHDRDEGSVRLRQPGDPAVVNARRVTMVLCRRDGLELPELSADHYPAESAICPVGMRAYREAVLGQWMCLRLDPDRVDPRTTPANRRVYAPAIGPGDTDTVADPTVLLCPLERVRRVQRPDGTTIAFALKGPVLRRKVIAHPLQRHAGRSVGPLPSAVGVAGLGRRVQVRTRMTVKPGEDFRVSGQTLRVTALDDHGFSAREILR